MISAGAMNKRLRIEAATRGRDPKTNAIVDVWTLVDEVYGFRRDTSAREFASGNSSGNTEQVATFTIWFRAGITPAYRIVSQGQIFNIVGISEIGQRYQLQIQAKAVNSTAAL